MLEEMLLKGATHNLIVRTRTEVALYVLNHKRAHLRDLESRFQITITVNADASVGAAQPFLIEKGEQVHSPRPRRRCWRRRSCRPIVEEDEDEEPVEDIAEEEEIEDRGDGRRSRNRKREAPSRVRMDAQRRGRRRRRRGRGGARVAAART
jgi:ribonuclease E